MREWIRRLWGTLRRNPRDPDLEDELRLHLELAAKDLRQRGGSPDDVPRAARLQAGGIAQAMEALRDQRGLPWLDDLARDVRHGLRSLRRSPAFTAVSLLTLALGIGANTAIFSIVNGVILRPLEYPKPEQLMYLTTHSPVPGFTEFWVAPAEYLEFRVNTETADDKGTSAGFGTIAGGRSRQLHGASAGRSSIHAEKMARDATGARIDLNTVATTVVSVATSLTRSRHSRRN